MGDNQLTKRVRNLENAILDLAMGEIKIELVREIIAQLDKDKEADEARDAKEQRAITTPEAMEE